MEEKKHIRILQLSDLHFFADRNTKLLEINPYVTFSAVMDLVKKDSLQKKPDLLLLTGDLSHDYSAESYELVKEACRDISAPVGALLGNHDVTEMFVEHLSLFNNNYFSFPKWQVLLLNSHWSGKVAGFLEESELDFVERKLKDSPEKASVIFLHHQVLPVRSAWLDRIGLSNADALLAILNKHSNVKLVVSGHVHQESSTKLDGIHFVSTPSTSWQFACNSDLFKLGDLMPGYRWLNLYEDGSYETEVVRVLYDPKFVPPANDKGY